MFLLILTLFHLVSSAFSYPGGAPESSCKSLAPGHSGQPQKTPFPFTLTLSKTKVKPGEKLEVKISGKEFKGFLAQGRKVGSEEAAGTFLEGGNHRLLNCGHKDSTATHKNDNEKSISLTWIAPAEKGEYKIFVTIVELFEVYWVAHPSQAITVA